MLILMKLKTQFSRWICFQIETAHVPIVPDRQKSTLNVYLYTQYTIISIINMNEFTARPEKIDLKTHMENYHI